MRLLLLWLFILSSEAFSASLIPGVVEEGSLNVGADRVRMPRRRRLWVRLSGHSQLWSVGVARDRGVDADAGALVADVDRGGQAPQRVAA